MFNFFRKKDKSGYKFQEPEKTACFICDHVYNRTRPILYASHDGEDGTWQFMCGQTDHTARNAKIISLKQATQIDATINDLWQMKFGFAAERPTPESAWNQFKKT